MNTRKVTELPSHVKGLATECDAYFALIINALTGFLEQQGCVNPVTQQYFLARSIEDTGYEGNTPIATEKWNLYWVANLDSNLLDESSQWLWITSSFYRGEGTKAVVLSSEVTFYKGKVRQPQFSGWSVCGNTPSKDTRVDYTTNGHLMELTPATFEELAIRAEKVLRENALRALSRHFFPKK